ncbi:MAG: hypothetical protein HYR96_10930, partial [Deltaproteobacteria bacterium]|nr:hypothetical protein [Deltaproteobacteria bacterium]
FTLRFVPLDQWRAGVVDDQAAHLLWGRRTIADLQTGDWLLMDAVGREEAKTLGSRVRGKRGEILQEEGE